MQIFGWAPIDDATVRGERKTSSPRLEAGERRHGDYVTENPTGSAGRGADGYGLTYLFGDGWVKFADTRQSLLLVETPQ